MIKIMISLLAILLTFTVWGEETSYEETSYEGNNYLEGISVLGKKKIAYISLEGGQITVNEGDEITLGKGHVKGTWQVVRIKQDSVLFKAKNGSTVELRLDSRLPLPPQVNLEPADQEKTPDLEPLEEAQTDLELEEVQMDDEIDPADLDPTHSDYQTMPTPFGELPVKDDEPITQADSPIEPMPITDNQTPTPTEEEAEVPPGHRVIKTPFGNFVVEGKK